MLTGDSKAAAEHIGALVGVDEVIPEVLPEEKAVHVQKLEAAGRKRGFLISGGEIDLERMSKVLLEEYRSCKLGRFTLESPEQMNVEEEA